MKVAWKKYTKLALEYSRKMKIKQELVYIIHPNNPKMTNNIWLQIWRN